MVSLGQVGAVQVRNHGDSCVFMACGVLPTQMYVNKKKYSYSCLPGVRYHFRR